MNHKHTKRLDFFITVSAIDPSGRYMDCNVALELSAS